MILILDKRIMDEKIKGAKMILHERVSQIEERGCDAVHDDQHKKGELIKAALYALTEKTRYSQGGEWEGFEEKVECDRHGIDNLVKAGALIAAEIDRLLRLYKAG